MINTNVLSDETKDILRRMNESLKGDTDRFSGKSVEDILLAIEHFGYIYASFDWFNEQVEKIDLVKRRGLIPGEPLPGGFQLFDSKGIPAGIQKRENINNLLDWLGNNEAMLGFFFPEGLTDEQKEIFTTDLNTLRVQPWSPQAALKAMLADWPEDQAEREHSLQIGEKRFREECLEFLGSI